MNFLMLFDYEQSFFVKHEDGIEEVRYIKCNLKKDFHNFKCNQVIEHITYIESHLIINDFTINLNRINTRLERMKNTNYFLIFEKHDWEFTIGNVTEKDIIELYYALRKEFDNCHDETFPFMGGRLCLNNYRISFHLKNCYQEFLFNSDDRQILQQVIKSR